jgi:hypothetical protein
MSTKFTSVYDTLRAAIAGVLTTHRELNNPYILTEDVDIMYDRAWTLAIGGAQNTQRSSCPYITIGREFNLILAQKYSAPQRDIAARLTAEKALLNYQLDALKILESTTSVDILKINYQSDNGIEFLGGDRIGYLVLQTLINVEYLEQI